LKSFKDRIFFFVMGGGCSGNSAITDWVSDNLGGECAVFLGDFEEIRMPGGLVDLSGDSDCFSRIKFSVVWGVIVHRIRVFIGESLYCCGLRKSRPPELQIRHSVFRHLRLYLLGVACQGLLPYKNIRLTFCINHLMTISKSKTIVLNNPLYYDDKSLEFLDNLKISPVFIFTRRRFSSQYPEWSGLDFSSIQSPHIKYIEGKYNGVERFFYHQESILHFQNQFNINHRCLFVSFEQFVLDGIYRKDLFFKLFGSNIKKEVSKRFVPENSLKNIKTDDSHIYSLSTNIDLQGLQEKFDLMGAL